MQGDPVSEKLFKWCNCIDLSTLYCTLKHTAKTRRFPSGPIAHSSTYSLQEHLMSISVSFVWFHEWFSVIYMTVIELSLIPQGLSLYALI